MAFNEALAERIRRRLRRRKNVDERKMFGGIVFLLNGNMLVGVWKDSLIGRLGQDQQEEALRELHVQKFDITGKPMRNWVLIEPEGVEADGDLKDWIERAVKFVRALPKK
jgi:TfoX/Sxy family transcriptional regulator of competence genes